MRSSVQKTAANSRRRCCASAWTFLKAPSPITSMKHGLLQRISVSPYHPAQLYPWRNGRRNCLREDDFERTAAHGLHCSRINEILIEESVIGWKEYELEIMRDKADNVSSSVPSKTSIRWASIRATVSRCAGTNAYRQAIPDHARCIHRHYQRNRR